MVELGSRVVVIIDGKEVADGKLEAWDGSPEGVSCSGIPCISGTCVVDRILVRPGCANVRLPIVHPEDATRNLDAVERWIFPVNVVIPYGETLEPLKKKRKKQDVPSLLVRRKVLKWMIEENRKRSSSDGLYADTMRQFPDIFHPDKAYYNANIKKITSWWLSGEKNFPDLYLPPDSQRGARLLRLLSLSRVNAGFRHRLFTKSLTGRGRKMAKWKKWLYPILKLEYDRLMSIGFGMNVRHIKRLAIEIVTNAPERSEFHKGSFVKQTYSKKSKMVPVLSLCNKAMAQHFMEHFNLVSRKTNGKPMVSPEKQLELDQQVAFFLGQLKKSFDENLINEDHIYNLDETHFVLNMTSGKIVVQKGSKRVKSMDVVSGTEGFTVVVIIKGGKEARLEPLFVIFKNKGSKYPIQGVPDNVPGVSYRTSPAGFMTSRIMNELLRSSKSWGRSTQFNPRENRVLTLDNVSSHMNSADIAKNECNTDLLYFPANTTHLLQPADQFVIKTFKDIFRQMWDDYLLDAIKTKKFQQKISADGTVIGSGKIRNPGKSYSLRLLKKAFEEFNNLKEEKTGWNYARKSMVMCGLSTDDSGVWKVENLSKALQEIIRKHPEYFSLQKCPPGMEAAVLNSPNDNVSSAVEPRPEEKENGNDAEAEDVEEDEEADVEDAEEDDDVEEEVETVADSEDEDGENYFVIEDDEEKYFIIDDEEETVESGNGIIPYEQAQASVPSRRSERVAKRRELTDDALIAAILAEDYNFDCPYDYDANWNDV